MQKHATAFRFEWMLMECFADLMPLLRKSLDNLTHWKNESIRECCQRVNEREKEKAIKRDKMTRVKYKQKQHWLPKFGCWTKNIRIANMFRFKWHVLLIFPTSFYFIIFAVDFVSFLRMWMWICSTCVNVCVFVYDLFLVYLLQNYISRH